MGRGLRNFDFALEEHIHAYFLMEQAEEANRESQNSGLFPTTSSAHVPGPYKYLPQSSSCSMVKLPTSTKAATADESTQLRAWSWTEPNTVYEWHWWGGGIAGVFRAADQQWPGILTGVPGRTECDLAHRWHTLQPLLIHTCFLLGNGTSSDLTHKTSALAPQDMALTLVLVGGINH